MVFYTTYDNPNHNYNLKPNSKYNLKKYMLHYLSPCQILILKKKTLTSIDYNPRKFDFSRFTFKRIKNNKKIVIFYISINAVIMLTIKSS